MDTSTDPTRPPSVPGNHPPVRLPAWARVLITTALLLPAAMAGSVLLLIPGFTPLLDRADGMALGAYAMLTAVTLAAYLLLSIALIRLVDRRPPRDLGLRLNGRALLGLLAGYGIAQVLAFLGFWGVQTLGWGRDADLGNLDSGMAEVSVGVVIAMVLLRAFVLQGIGEEVLFRGYLMQSLRSRPVLAVLITAVAFTLPHLASSGGQQNPLDHLYYLAIPFGFSISAAFLAIALRSVWAAVGIHGGFHLATVVSAEFGVIADGPAAWVALGALHLVVGVVIAALIPRGRWNEIRTHGPYHRHVSPSNG
jgi:membrane protease YdiL (CAAX protease family)